MEKRVVFVSIFDLTRVFYEIAASLADAGHSVFWITTHEVWTHWLLNNGVSRDDIQELVYSPDNFIGETEKQALLEQIVPSEHQADLTVNQGILVDQFIRRKNKPNINEYMYLYYRAIKSFLTAKQATHVVAEPTNSNEMITYMICRELGIQFLSPRDIRYPAQRLIFFDSYRQENAIPNTDAAEGINGRALIEAFAENKPAPYYFSKHNKAKTLDPHKFASTVKNRTSRKSITSGNSLTHHEFSSRLKLTLARVYNGYYLKHLCRYDKLDAIPGRLAFYGLHVQPEASIDVLGAYFSDQLKLIKDIRRALPMDTTLAVKEHPNFLGLKPISFFKELRRIPNVALLKHDVSTFEIYKRASILFTVSGTLGYEGGLLGIPVVTFCPMYFNGLSSVRLCTDMTKLRGIVYSLLHGFKRDFEADCRFVENLVGQSYPAFWSDPVNYPNVMDEENVAKLQAAFLDIIGREQG